MSGSSSWGGQSSRSGWTTSVATYTFDQIEQNLAAEQKTLPEITHWKLSHKLVCLLGAMILAASCARETIPTVFKGLDGQEVVAALSDTTVLYQTEHEMKFVYLGPNGEYRRWSDQGGIYILSGKWLVENENFCRITSFGNRQETHKYCEKLTEKFKQIAATFRGDALNMANRKYAFCHINYYTLNDGTHIKPSTTSTITALTAAAALVDVDNEENSRIKCDTYITDNQEKWYLRNKHESSKILEKIKINTSSGSSIEISTFDLISSQYFTAEGASVFRRYYQISNKLTNDARRANKFFVFQYLDPNY